MVGRLALVVTPFVSSLVPHGGCAVPPACLRGGRFAARCKTALSDMQFRHKPLRPHGLKRLRYFVCVSELGSFTLAARHLGVAQPALSRHIRQLEAECGSPLLRRNGRGAELSEVGRTVLEHGRSLLEQVGRLEAGLKAAKGAPVGASMSACRPRSA